VGIVWGGSETKLLPLTGENMKKIIFIPTWRCNLQCGYCDYSVDEHKDSYMLHAFGMLIPIEKELTWQEWSQALKKFDPFILEMTGGEPTLYKGLPELLGSLPIDSKWAITSNTLLTDNINKLPTYNCQDWTASYHFHSDDIFLKNIDTIKNHGVPLRITIVLTPDNIDTVKQKVKEFTFEGHGVNIHPILKQGFSWADHNEIWQEASSMAEKNAYINFIDDISSEWKPEKHDICQAGMEDYFVLMPDGTVLRCYSEILQYSATTSIKDFVPAEQPEKCYIDCMFPCDKQIARETNVE